MAAGVANLIGGLIFYWVDRFIFTSPALSIQWEIKDNVKCVDCGRISRGYRLVRTVNYDRMKDTNPQFRCEEHSKKKTSSLRKKGIKI